MSECSEVELMATRVLIDRRFCADTYHKALAEAVLALTAENKALIKLAVELRGSVECHNVDHCKAEQHELGDPCKVLARIDTLLAKGRQP